MRTEEQFYQRNPGLVCSVLSAVSIELYNVGEMERPVGLTCY